MASGRGVSPLLSKIPTPAADFWCYSEEDGPEHHDTEGVLGDDNVVNEISV